MLFKYEPTYDTYCFVITQFTIYGRSQRVENLCKINATNKERCDGKHPRHVTISAAPDGSDTILLFANLFASQPGH